MKVGTAEPIIEEKEPVPGRRAKSRTFRGGTSGGGKNGGGGGGGGNDGGGDKPEYDLEEPQENTADKAKFVTWFLLLIVLMTFGGMIGAYVVIASNGASEWKPFDLPFQVWISTALIIASSVTYQLGKNALFAERFGRSRNFFLATTVLGATFISSQLLVWMALVKRGMYMSGNPYAGFFYILTAAHALHVIGGMIALGVVLLRNWNETSFEIENEYRRNLTRSVGWYWHFLGALWIVLLMMLGFWK